jgi:cell division protein FtsN
MAVNHNLEFFEGINQTLLEKLSETYYKLMCKHITKICFTYDLDPKEVFSTIGMDPADAKRFGLKVKATATKKKSSEEDEENQYVEAVKRGRKKAATNGDDTEPAPRPRGRPRKNKVEADVVVEKTTTEHEAVKAAKRSSTVKKTEHVEPVVKSNAKKKNAPTQEVETKEVEDEGFESCFDSSDEDLFDE